MNKEEIKERNYNLLVDFVDSLGVLDDSLNYHFKYIDFDEVCTFDWITRFVESNGGLKVDFCDINEAMRYLMVEDPTLQNSLEIYKEMECPNNADSCMFASILATSDLVSNWYYYKNEITDFLDNLEWYEEEDDED